MDKNSQRRWNVYLFQDNEVVLPVEVGGQDAYEAKKNWWAKVGKSLPKELVFTTIYPYLRVKRVRY